jgi:two-component system, LytTR family, sensor kinase
MSQWRARVYEFGVIVCAWTAITAVGVTSSSLRSWAAGEPSGGSIWPSVAAALFWSALTPPILWLGRRFPVEQRGRRARSVLVHAAAVAAVVAADGALNLALSRWLGLARGATYLQHALRYSFINVVNYLGVLLVALYLAKRVRAAELEAQLVRANLRALQMQLRLHFLFNALNTVAGLIRSDEKRAATACSSRGAMFSAARGATRGATGDLTFAGRLVKDALFVDVSGELCRP